MPLPPQTSPQIPAETIAEPQSPVIQEPAGIPAETAMGTASYNPASSWPRPTRPFDESGQPEEDWPRPTTSADNGPTHPGPVPTPPPAEVVPTPTPVEAAPAAGDAGATWDVRQPVISDVTPPQPEPPVQTSSGIPARAIAEPPTNHRTRTVLIIILVVAVVLAGLAFFLVPRFLDDPDRPGNAVSPTEAVQEYLTAVASGDATTALLYSTTKPGEDTTFTTNDFLTSLMKASPITNINVPDDQPTTSPVEIQATYTLNGEQVQAHFTVRKYGRLWKLDIGFLPLNVTELTDQGVPLTVNGVSLDVATKLYLFPGVYTFTSMNPMLDLTLPTFTIDYPENPTIFREGFTLSQQGIAAIQAAAATHLTTCLATQQLAPQGCGFGFAGTTAGEIDPTSITWALTDDDPDISTIAPGLEGNSTTVAIATIQITVTFGGISLDKQHLYEGTSSFNTVRADFSNPDNIRVSFGTV